jgi:hypothetical protein
MNHLRRAWRVPAFEVGTEDPVFPVSRAYDHSTGGAAKFTGMVADSAIVIDKDVLVDGDFSTAELEGWVVDAGSLDADGFIGSDSAFHQDLTAVPGELWSLYLDLQSEGGGIKVARIRNLHNGRYLASNGSWSDAVVDFQTDEGSLIGEWVFQVEPYSECRAREVTLRLTIEGQDGQLAEAAMWPHSDLACIFGYNYPPGGLIPSVIDASASSFDVGFLRDAGMSVLWAYFGECKGNRLFRFKWAGTPLDPIAFGELVLTQTTKIARSNAPGGVAPRLDMELESRFPQEREDVPSGALYVTPSGSGEPARHAQMSFFLTSEAELSRLRDEIFGASQGGAHPSILVGPTAIGREVCMFGRFVDRLPQSFPGGPGVVYCKVELGFEEDVFPRYSTAVLA